MVNINAIANAVAEAAERELLRRRRLRLAKTVRSILEIIILEIIILIEDDSA
jgi:hypothetical protein